jgi:hypothetical protein
MKKLLKWTGISLLILLLLLIIAPFLFKGKIESAIKDAANDNLNARINWSSVDLSLIRNFPNLRIAIKDLTVDNTVAPFDSVRLAQIGSIEAVVDIKSLFGDQINIKRIGIVKPTLDVRVTKDGIANYDIVKSDSTAVEEPTTDEEPSKFNIKLREYYLREVNLRYDDKSMPVFAHIENLNHEGKGDFTQDLFTLITKTTADKITVNYDGTTYLKNVKTVLDADIDMDMVNSKYSIANNVIRLNELELAAEGWLAMPGEDIDMDIAFKMPKNDFRQILSMVPMEFASDLKGVDAKGSVSLDGFVKGKMNETSMPNVGLNLAVKDGWFKYPDLPKSINNIQIKTAIYADMNNMDKTTVDVDQFHLEMAQNPVDMKLKLRTPESNPFIDFVCKAFVDLDNVQEFIPLENSDEVHGQINADIALKGNYSSIEKERYSDFHAEGLLDITNVMFKSDSLPYNLQVNRATFGINPSHMDLSTFDALIGQSDLKASGKIHNYLAYALHDSLLQGSFNLSSNLINLNEFMSSGETETTTEVPTEESSALAPIELPGNIDFALNASIGKLIYDNIEITNARGGIGLKDKVASLNNLVMNVMDGTVGMTGHYNAQDLSLPKMDFLFDIKDMNVNKAANMFATIEKMAPIAKACNGSVNTRFTMKSDLGQDMMPINSSVNGKGVLSTKSITIKDFEPLMKLADKINLDKLKQTQHISDINVSFKIENGVVTTDPFTVKLIDGIPAKVYGYTTLDQDISYNVDMDIPVDKFASGAINQANTWIGEINKKLGSNLSVGNKINMIALITGKVTDPKISVTSKALGEDAVSNLKDQAVTAIKEEAKEQLTNLKNEALEKAIAEKERLVNEAKAARDKAIAEAEVQAEKIKKEGEAIAKKGKDEAYKAADDLVNKAKNPLEKAGAKLAADKAKKEADNAYNKAVDKTNAEANKAVDLARQKADKLVADAEARGDKLINDASNKGDQQINKIDNK